ncbi:MAG TPA: hypothetical protein VHJ83_15635, partial [Micromonosporaceae bacterium]|nr:hypothetical protein [Micromonosporaceae bacterium]
MAAWSAEPVIRAVILINIWKPRTPPRSTDRHHSGHEQQQPEKSDTSDDQFEILQSQIVEPA